MASVRVDTMIEQQYFCILTLHDETADTTSKQKHDRIVWGTVSGFLFILHWCIKTNNLLCT